MMPLDFDFDTFTAGMAKRATGVFAASPIVQGNWDGTGVPDSLLFTRGDQIGNPTDYAYANLDLYQGSIVFWITPEWDGNDGLFHFILRDDSAQVYIYKTTANALSCVAWGTGFSTVSTATWTAGTTYCVVFRWDVNRTIDGTNYACVSVNDVHTYGEATPGTPTTFNSNIRIGSSAGTLWAVDALIEGLTIYRRPLLDSNGYGVAATFDASGPVDEIGAIYAAGAGADPCLTTGSWDVVFCLPTDATEEALVTGTGEAWSHPHGSNVFNHWTLEDAFYGGYQWALLHNGTSTYVDCGSAVGIDNLPNGATLTIDYWVRLDADPASSYAVLLQKGNQGADGYLLVYDKDNDRFMFEVELATAEAEAYSGTFVPDGKWHLVTAYYADGTKTARVALDGVWGAADVGVGAYQLDAARNLMFGRAVTAGTWFFEGAQGYIEFSNNDRHGGAAGTDFIAPRAPYDDGNRIESWHANDGTGANLTATVNAAHDGTITAGTWEQQWDDVLTPVMPTSLEFDGSATILNGTSGANIDNLPGGANGFTAEGWFRHDSAGESNSGMFWTKTGWYMQMASASTVRVFIDYDTTDINETFNWTPDGKWHHWLLTYNENGADRFARVYRDGVLVHTTAASVGNYVADAASTFYVGNNAGATATMNGAIGSQELSDNVRESATFVPASRIAPRANDANMHLRYAMTDGAGLAVADTSGNGYNGTITMGSGRWWNTPDAENEGPGSRIYQWGMDIGSDAANDGIHQHLAGQAAGANFVARVPVRYEADKRAQPSIVAYDETNGAAITTFNGPWLMGVHDGGAAAASLSDSTAPYWPYSLVGGTVYNITDGSSATITAAGNSIVGALAGGGSNDWNNGEVYYIVPPARWAWCEPFTFELPTIARNGAAADCTEMSDRLLNSAGEGLIYWCEAAIYENLADNPSLETGAGNPWLPDGWANYGLDAGDSQASSAGGGIIHSGADCMEFAVGASDEGISQQITAAAGSFVKVGIWTYGDGSAGFTIGGLNATQMLLHGSTTAFNVATPHTAQWRLTEAVFRCVAANPTIYLIADAGAAGVRYADDISVVADDDVTLTATPASEANSAETSGLRVDGQDLCSWTPPAGRLLAPQGWLRWNWTPRHDAADLAGFAGAANLPYIVYVFGDANNNIIVEVTAANTIQLDVTANAVNAVANWNCAGAIVAGTTYKMEVRWDGNWFRFIVDDVVQAQVNPAGVFTLAPTLVYWGCNAAPIHEADATYAAP